MQSLPLLPPSKLIIGCVGSAMQVRYSIMSCPVIIIFMSDTHRHDWSRGVHDTSSGTKLCQRIDVRDVERSELASLVIV